MSDLRDGSRRTSRVDGADLRRSSRLLARLGWILAGLVLVVVVAMIVVGAIRILG